MFNHFFELRNPIFFKKSDFLNLVCGIGFESSKCSKCRVGRSEAETHHSDVDVVDVGWVGAKRKPTIPNISQTNSSKLPVKIDLMP
jgi:hypothetical protein